MRMLNVLSEGIQRSCNLRRWGVDCSWEKAWKPCYEVISQTAKRVLVLDLARVASTEAVGGRAFGICVPTFKVLSVCKDFFHGAYGQRPLVELSQARVGQRWSEGC
jgi:hypothetical protein